MKYEKIIDIKLKDLCHRKNILEKDYDGLFSNFIDKGRQLKNHETYTRILNVTYSQISILDEQIKLLEEIKNEAQ